MMKEVNMAENTELNEEVIRSWIKLTGVLKNTRITQGMIYNEAIVMNIVYGQYLKDGVGLVPFKDIVAQTRMLKSLVNRTIESLVKKGYLIRSDGKDKRTTFVQLVPENLDVYMEVHNRTLKLVDDIVTSIGEDDARAFVRISKRICEADPLNN